jgi:hypothetical protein
MDIKVCLGERYMKHRIIANHSVNPMPKVEMKHLTCFVGVTGFESGPHISDSLVPRNTNNLKTEFHLYTANIYNSVPTSQTAQPVSLERRWLMLFREITAVYCENCTRHTKIHSVGKI